MNKSKFVKQQNGNFIEVERPQNNVTTYKYTKYFFESDEIPKCGLCGSGLTFRQTKNKREIKCCNNPNCITNNNKIKGDKKLKAFLPDYIYKEIKQKRSEHSFNNLEYIKSKGYTEEEAIRIQNKWKNHFTELGKQNLGKTKEEYCKRHNISLEEYDKKLRKQNFLCLEYYLERGYSEEEGKCIISNIQKKNSIKSQLVEKDFFTKDKMRRLGYSEKEILTFNKERSKWTKEFYIKRGYSEEDAIKEVSKLQSNNSKRISHETYLNSSPRRKEYYINNGATEEEAIAAVKTYQTTFSKEICIKKYGEEKGLEVFNKRQEKWQESLLNNGNIKGGYSKISQECFNYLIENRICNFGNEENIRYATKNSEYAIQYKDKNWCYDFTDLNHNKIIEFNGDVYHGNPEFFDKNDYPHPYNKNEKAKHIWARDKGKQKIANKFGFDVLVIWEYDWKHRKEHVIQQIQDFYGEKNN